MAAGFERVRKEKPMRRSFIVALVLGAALVGFAPPASAGDNFVAPMSGDEEVPPVDTQATGVATFKLGAEGLAFKVNVANIDNVIFAHIHCGAVGVNGPVGVTLFHDGPVTVNGTLAAGVITAPDPGNACGWADLDAVVAALESGDTYVNVHTTAHPGGEIRGQTK
jgi:CHRD domain